MNQNINPEQLLQGIVAKIDELKDTPTKEVHDIIVGELVNSGMLSEEEASAFVERALEFVRPNSEDEKYESDEEEETDEDVEKVEKDKRGDKIHSRKCKCGCTSKPKKAARGRKICACCGGSKL